MFSAISNAAAPPPSAAISTAASSARPRCPSTTPASTATVPPARARPSSAGSRDESKRLLPTDYFHVVFTLPALLRPLARRYRRLLYDLLFATAAETLLTFGRDPKRLGAELGFTLVLHTWTRDLRFHPHVHAIVTGGGLDVHADRWVSARQDYLFPVQALSRLFRGKFLAALIALFEQGTGKDTQLDSHSFRTLTRRLARQAWVVYAKKPFGRLRSEASAAGRGPEQIVSYLGLYTHRVALSNSRLHRKTQDHPHRDSPLPAPPHRCALFAPRRASQHLQAQPTTRSHPPPKVRSPTPTRQRTPRTGRARLPATRSRHYRANFSKQA